MDYAQAVSVTAWGNESCALKLPGFKVTFNGLTSNQKKTILLDYSSYLISDDSIGYSNDESVLKCDAYQLEKEVGVPISELEKDGQYAPIKKRKGNGISITGLNFVASINWNSVGNDHAQIGVKDEEELASPLVLENFLRIYTAHNAIKRLGAVLHSAGLVFDENAYVFVGYSGVGKTTLTRKAHKYGAVVLSDDLNLILPSESGDSFEALKVPFTGEFGRTVDHGLTGQSYPLKAIVLLEQSDEFMLRKVEKSTAISRLLAGSPFVNTDETEIEKLFEIFNNLVNQVPVVKLGLPYDTSIDDILVAINDLI